MSNLLTTVYAIDLFSPVAKWIALGVVVICLFICVAVFLLKKELFAKTLKILSLFLFAFLLIMGMTLLIMTIVKEYSVSEIGDEKLRLNIIKFILIPLLITIFVLFLSVLLSIFTSKYKKTKFSLTIKICGAISLVFFIYCGISLAIYFNNFGDESVNSLVLYILAGILTITVVALAFIFDKNDTQLNTRCIVTAGITIAMSFGLSYVKLFRLPQGGSITLCSLLPIMLFSFIYGTKKGVLVCFCYGVLQAIQDPWIVHPAQFLLDYPIAYSTIGLCGIFVNSPLKIKNPQISILFGGILSGILLFCSRVFSGVFAFSTYAQGLNPFIYSLGYNSVVLIDTSIAIVVAIILFSSKSFLKELTKNTVIK